jgi:replicative DNA helicase
MSQPTPPKPSPFGRRRDEQMSAEECLAALNVPLPFSDESEKGVLSGLFQDPEKLSSLRSKLTEESFYHEANRTIYAEMLVMDDNDVPIEPVGMTNRLRDQGKLDRVGGPSSLTELYTFIPSPMHVAIYAKSLQDLHRQRRAIHGLALAIKQLQRHGVESDVDIETTINTATATVQTFMDSSTAVANTTATLSACLNEHVEYMSEVQTRIDAGDTPLIPTGFPTLDMNCGGIGTNEYWLVTGPTKSGKSVLTGNISTHAARKNFPTVVFTNELGRVQYTGRLIAAETSVKLGGIDRHGFKDRAEQEAYMQAIKKLRQDAGKTYKIDTAAGRYVEDIVAQIRSEAVAGFKLFIIDLIGKLRTRQKFGSREQELAHVSLSLCDAAKKYNVAVIAVAQENSDGDVRESKSLAMDCDAWLKVAHVMSSPEKKRGFSKTEEKPEIVRDRRDIIVELARGFSAGDKIRCLFDGPRFTIRELARDGTASDWTENM